VMRGAVISEVQPISPRRRVAKIRAVAARSLTEEGTILVGADSKRARSSTTALTIMLSAGAVIAVGAATVALVVTGIL
jgi:hypothetical protein